MTPVNKERLLRLADYLESLPQKHFDMLRIGNVDIDIDFSKPGDITMATKKKTAKKTRKYDVTFTVEVASAGATENKVDNAVSSIIQDEITCSQDSVVHGVKLIDAFDFKVTELTGEDV